MATPGQNELGSTDQLVSQVRSLAATVRDNNNNNNNNNNTQSVLLWAGDDDLDVVTRIGASCAGRVLTVCFGRIPSQAHVGVGTDPRQVVAWWFQETDNPLDPKLVVVTSVPGDEPCVQYTLGELTPPGGFDVVVVGHDLLRKQPASVQSSVMRPALSRLAPGGRVLLTWSPLDEEMAGRLVFTPNDSIVPRQHWAYRQPHALAQVNTEITEVADNLGCEVERGFEPEVATVQAPFVDVLSAIPPVLQEPGRLDLLQAVHTHIVAQGTSNHGRHPAEAVATIRIASSVENVIRLLQRPDSQTIIECARECWPDQPPMKCLVIDLAQTVDLMSMTLRALAGTGPAHNTRTDGTAPARQPKAWWVGYAVLKPRSP